MLAARAGYAERHLPALGVSTPTLRRLRYLELPPWSEVEQAATALCDSDRELQEFRRLWQAGEGGLIGFGGSPVSGISVVRRSGSSVGLEAKSARV